MIKKLFTILVASSILFACGGDDDPGTGGNTTITLPGMGKPTNPIPESAWLGDWNDRNDPNYKKDGYNPLQGDWILKSINGQATNQFLVYSVIYGRGIYTLTAKPAEGVAPKYSSLKPYQINNKQIKDDRSYIYNYTVAQDRSWMTLNDGKNTYRFEVYDNNSVWLWKGDWNATYNPYYSVYNGKYNPIEGIWKIEESTLSSILYNDTSFYIKYDNDFSVVLPKSIDNFPVGKLFYEINDIGLLQKVDNRYYKYWIEGNTMYLNEVGYSSNGTPTDKTAKLIRVK